MVNGGTGDPMSSLNPNDFSLLQAHKGSSGVPLRNLNAAMAANALAAAPQPKAPGLTDMFATTLTSVADIQGIGNAPPANTSVAPAQVVQNRVQPKSAWSKVGPGSSGPKMDTGNYS